MWAKGGGTSGSKIAEGDNAGKSTRDKSGSEGRAQEGKRVD